MLGNCRCLICGIGCDRLQHGLQTGCVETWEVGFPIFFAILGARSAPGGGMAKLTAFLASEGAGD